ncbi:tetratricopeptide repeat protein [Halomonadaceae bacterium KBTZ08]
MQAQTQLEEVTREQEAALARRLLQANELYRFANSPDTEPGMRGHARQQVREALDVVLTAQPEHPEALNLLGRVAMDEGQLAQAAELLERARVAAPASGQVLANLGYLALLREEPEHAEALFDKALTQDRQSAPAFAGKAHALRQQQRFDQAYLHYRCLLDCNRNWDSVYAGMLECARHLDIQRADSALAHDAIRLLSHPGLPHQELSRFVTRLLRQQYAADIEAGDWLLDTICTDELLLLALETTLLVDPDLEKLITRARHALLMEVRDTGELYESRQRLAMALSRYANRTGFAQMVTEEEEAFLRELDANLKVELRDPFQPEEVAAGLILRSLYGALFHQPYAQHIGRFTLEDWPQGMQPLMAESYYHKAEEEAYKQQFQEKQDELALAREDLPHAWPCWHNLRLHHAQPLKQELAQSLGIDTSTWPETVRILVIGAGSGQHAMELAHYFTDVEVVAVDENLAGLAHGNRLAREKDLQNIVFWPYSLATRFIQDGNQVQMVEIRQLPSETHEGTPIKTLAQQALDSGGLLHIHTGEHGASRVDVALRRMMERHKLQPTTETLRRLRRMILNNPKHQAYQALLNEPDFYATAGCRKRWFFPEDISQLDALMDNLSSEVDWKLLRARDTDGANLATAPVVKQLQAQAFGTGAQSLVGQGLSLYFQRRR